MGSVPEPGVGLPDAGLVGARTVHRSSFHVQKTAEIQLHSQSWFFIISAFPHFDPLNPGLVSFQVLLNRPLPVIKMNEIYICLQ